MKTILVVDDEKSLRNLVKAYLTQEGFRVVTAENGRRALFVARHEKLDLILLDILMPEMDGYDFIRTYRRERDTPIILLTAELEESDKVVGLELGADDYVIECDRSSGQASSGTEGGHRRYPWQRRSLPRRRKRESPPEKLR